MPILQVCLVDAELGLGGRVEFGREPLLDVVLRLLLLRARRAHLVTGGKPIVVLKE